MKLKLNQIMHAKKIEIACAKKEHNIGDLKRMIRDTPPLRSFKKAISGDFGIIAEIKKRTPSMGEMRRENFDQALDAYNESHVVKAISVITDSKYFGMDHSYLLKAKQTTGKPVLKKDFINSEYAIYQARAYGADAVLLMSSVLQDNETAIRLISLARELDLDILFEAHNDEEIRRIPGVVDIYGINSRNFMSRKKWNLSRMIEPVRSFLPLPDITIKKTAFSLIKNLPRTAIKVAESGITSRNIISCVISRGYNAALIGTSLLQAPEGVRQAVSAFERAVAESKKMIRAEC